MTYPEIMERAAQIVSRRLEQLRLANAKGLEKAARPARAEMRRAFEQWKLHPDPVVAEQMFDQAFGDGAWFREVSLAVNRQRKAGS